MINLNTSPVELSTISAFTSQLLNRFNIDARSTKPLHSIKLESQVDPSFVLDLINAPFNSEFTNTKTLKRYDIVMVVNYLKHSHTEYLNKRIPEIEQLVTIFTNGLRPTSAFSLSLNSIFSNYKTHLEAHIAYEEQKLFPYALHLTKHQILNAKEQLLLNNYSAMQFLAEHQHSPIDIDQIIKLVVTHHPSKTNSMPYNMLLQNISVFKEDMSLHELIEDHVLVPKLIALEME